MTLDVKPIEMRAFDSSDHHLPDGMGDGKTGWYLPIRVFVKDADDKVGLVGPWTTREDAVAAALGIDRGVIHVTYDKNA